MSFAETLPKPASFFVCSSYSTLSLLSGRCMNRASSWMRKPRIIEVLGLGMYLSEA